MIYYNSPQDPPTNGVVATLAPLPKDNNELVANPAMCYHCFDVLTDSLKSKSGNKKRSNTALPEFGLLLADASVECPLFVTWEIKKSPTSENYNLRGCIGTLSPRLLVSSVGEYALTSAFRDRRFSPITASEMALLRVSVSLLVQYEECANVFDWEIGKHGILIKFCERGVDYSATYLPEVAKEQGWDLERAVSSLIQKAGYHGPTSSEFMKSVHCTRYQSSKCQVPFGEYVSQNCQGNDPLPNKPHRQWNPCNNL
jgi:uncharacterized protein (TIGR00296 family)